MRAGSPIANATDFSQLLDPTSALWRARPAHELSLNQTPAGMQPGLYVASAYATRPYGTLPRATLRCAWQTDGGVLFHLSWRCDKPAQAINDTNQFADAAALLFAEREETPLITMGAAGMPVTAWYWRAERETPLFIRAEGLGSSSRSTDTALVAKAIWEQQHWQVVIGHNQQRLPDRIGIAIWQGEAQERAGLKSATLAWEPVRARA